MKRGRRVLKKCALPLVGKHSMTRKKRTVLPFTRQYAHQQQLKKQGKTPRFGSYEYDAQRLHEKGVLVELKEVPPAKYVPRRAKVRVIAITVNLIDENYDALSVPVRHSWKRVSITISSDEVGVFEVNGKFMGVNLYTTELRLEDLLQRQFDKVQTMTLFGTAVVNVNLLLYLINKKFYV